MNEIWPLLPLVLWVASASIGAFGAAYFAWQVRHFARLRFTLRDPPPAAVVIVPLKGASATAEQALRAILAQDYPRFRLLVAVESETDAAHRLATALRAQHGACVGIVVAGRAGRRGQKVHNLAAALAATTAADEIVCFADADALWPRDALSTLAAELLAWDEPVLLSGHRWIVPAAAGLGAVAVAAANLAVAAIAKSPAWDVAWGGTMAARRETLARVDLATIWARALSDDVTLSHALRRGGAHVKLMPNLAVASPAAFGIGDALAFMRRQYAMLRLYAPRHWLFSLLVYAIFFAGLGASLAAFLDGASAAALALASAGWALAFARGFIDAGIALSVLPRERAARMAWPCLLDTVFPFVPALLHAYGLATTVVVRRLRWAGITYTMDAGTVLHAER